MSNQDQQLDADQQAAELKGQLLSLDNVQMLAEKVAAVSQDMTEFEFAGEPGQISQLLGQYNYNKGMLYAYKSLLEDHQNAVTCLRQQQ